MITDEEWNLLQDLVDVLEQFAVATDYLGGSTYCTHSIINPFIEQIKANLIKPPSNSSSSLQSPYSSSVINQEVDGDDAFAEEDLEIHNLNQSENRTPDLLQTVKTKLYENLCEYWNFQDPDILLASLLDPRTKNLDDIPIRVRIQTEELLRNKVEELKLNHELSSDPIPTSSKTQSNFAKFQKSKQRPRTVDNEISEYLSLEEISWEEDPFEWWKLKEKHFYYLSLLAHKYLPIPAASTASERMFSDAGNLMGPKRIRMDPELFKKLIFLKRNFIMLASIHPSVLSNSTNI